jgi:dethiobiotin synthetase
MTGFFVTATGTDIGKTYITAGLVKAMGAKAIKPVVSGFDGAQPHAGDAGALLEAMGEAPTLENIARIAPWRFAAPLSPDMAAAREGRAIDLAELAAFTRQNVKDGLVFVEGVGGVMVPLSNKHTTLDWMAEVQLPLILVTGSYLGTLSHTLTAVDVAQRRGLKIALVVVNESPESPVPLAETCGVIARHTGLPCVTLARGASDFSEIAAKLA